MWGNPVATFSREATTMFLGDLFVAISRRQTSLKGNPIVVISGKAPQGFIEFYELLGASFHRVSKVFMGLS